MSEEILLCPVVGCGAECRVWSSGRLSSRMFGARIHCALPDCYDGPIRWSDTRDEALAEAIHAHNRIASAVRDADALRTEVERLRQDAFVLSKTWGDSAADADALRVDLADARERCSLAAHTLIDHIGSVGPENVEEAAQRAVGLINALRAENARLREALEQWRQRATDAEEESATHRLLLEKLGTTTATTTPRLRSQAERVAAEREEGGQG